MSASRPLIPRTVVVLGLVSFFNDAASEMITPLLPLFLVTTLGAGPAVVGLVEGIAEATSSLLKLISGYLADRGWNSKKLLVGGYGVSNTARPLIGLAFGWGLVLFLRFADRLGKGLRTSPRDALIAEAAEPALRGRAFGFHRAMDHAGAVVGPLLAFALLAAGIPLPHVFLYSAVPGALVLLLLWRGLPHGARTVPPAPPALPRWAALDARLRAIVLAAGGLALATAPEIFLVLWAQEHELAIVWIPLLWAAASLVKMLVAIPAGMLSDRAGRLPVVAAGWGARVLVLLSLALAPASLTMAGVWALFLAYAATLAFTEAPERSLIGDVAPDALKGTAFGLYHLVSGVLVLPGAAVFGLIWQRFGHSAAFVTSAMLTLLAAAILLSVARATPRN